MWGLEFHTPIPIMEFAGISVMQSLFKQVQCVECGQLVAADLYPGACSACGSLWMNAIYDLDALPNNWPERVSGRPTNLWRYRELLPFPDDMKLVSMGEGWTPMTRAEGLEAETGHTQIWIKDERQQPTGSFKDRQAACAVSALKSRGIYELVLSSTGNAAAAYAAFCARAGIKLWVFLLGLLTGRRCNLGGRQEAAGGGVAGA